MKAVQFTRFGGPDVLEIVDVPKPRLQEGEVLIRVKAAGINYFETLMRKNRYGFSPELPMIPGVEVAGIVEEVGAGAEIAVGSRVAVPLFAIGRSGGYAEFVAVAASAVHPIPEGLPFEIATALLVQGLTVLHAIRCSPPTGKVVLVPAAAGGVGSLLVQLARQSGADRIVAAAGTKPKLDIAQRLGADTGVTYGSEGWGAALHSATDGEGIDIVYDFVGGGLSTEYLPALAPEAQVLFGALGRADIKEDALNMMINRNQSLRGLALIPLLTPENLKTDLAQLFALAARRELEVLIGARYPLDEAAAAHRAIEERETIGKTLLIP